MNAAECLARAAERVIARTSGAERAEAARVAWPAGWPPPQLVAAELAEDLAAALAVIAQRVSQGFIRAGQEQRLPPKPPPPVADGLRGEAELRHKVD